MAQVLLQVQLVLVHNLKALLDQKAMTNLTNVHLKSPTWILTHHESEAKQTDVQYALNTSPTWIPFLERETTN